MGAKHKWINLALTAGFGMLLICFPAESAQGVINGMKLALGKVIPALFPYFVLSGFVLGSGFSGGKTAQRVMRKVFHLPAACAPAMLLGFVGGYPVGARTAAQLYREGACTEEELSRLLTFCNNAGPGFFLAFIGNGMFHSPGAGLLLYAVHVCSALVTGLLLRDKSAPPIREKPADHKNIIAFTEVFPAALSGAVESSLAIGGTVVFFSVLLSLLDSCGLMRLLPSLSLLRAVFFGGFELTSGISVLTGPLTAVTAAAAAGLTGWGGLCVHCQTFSVLRKAVFSTKRYLFAKGLHGLISAISAFALFSIPGTLTSAASFPSGNTVVRIFPSVLFVFVCILLFSLGKRGGKTFQNRL